MILEIAHGVVWELTVKGTIFNTGRHQRTSPIFSKESQYKPDAAEPL
jgi:hypothetical protein